MRKILCITILLSLFLITVIANESDSDVVNLNLAIANAADIRKSTNQGTQMDINGLTYSEIGHGSPASPVRVESWYTIRTHDPFTDGLGNTRTWYYTQNYAFGWEYLGNDDWDYEDFKPEDIENQVYDEGLKKTYKENGNYLFIGNHTRFHIATNYRPLVQFTAPSYLTNGNNQITVRQIQVGWGISTKYAVIPGGQSETLSDYPCRPGNYSTNQFAIFAVIEMPEEWWTLESGEYLGTAVLTLQSP